MPDITIQFEAEPGADVNALAARIQSQLAALDDVQKVNTEVMESRDPLAIGTAIMTFLTVAPVVMANAAKTVAALNDFIKQCDGVRNTIVEIRGRRIPVEHLKPSDLAAPAAQ